MLAVKIRNLQELLKAQRGNFLHLDSGRGQNGVYRVLRLVDHTNLLYLVSIDHEIGKASLLKINHRT